MEYNPYYDNTLETNRRSNFLQSNGKRVVQEQKEQIMKKEEQIKQGKASQIEWERKIANETPIPMYLQRDDRNYRVSAAERKEIIRNMENEANKNSDGGFFSKVFQQKDNKEQRRQQEKQAYIDEIQKQIDDKKRKKEEEKQRNMEEDRKYEEKIIKDIERMKEKSMVKEDKQVIKTIKNKHLIQQQEESKMIFNEFDQINMTNFNIVPNYLKDNLKEVDDKFEQDLKPKTNPHTPNTKLQSQRTLQDQNLINITYNQPNTANNRSQRNNSNYQQQEQFAVMQQQQQQQQQLQQFQQYQMMQQQQYLMQQQYFQNQPPHFQQDVQYQPFEQRPVVPMMLERFQREFEELKMANRMKNKEQEDSIEKLKEQIESQSTMWNEDIRKLRAEVQLSVEQKQKAFYELENLKDQLKQQEMYEQSQLNALKNQHNQSFQNDSRKLVTQKEFHNHDDFYNSFEQI